MLVQEAHENTKPRNHEKTQIGLFFVVSRFRRFVSVRVCHTRAKGDRIMRNFVLAAAIALASGGLAQAAAQSGSADQQIADATRILPEDLRAGATVVTYDASGARKILRQGTNFVECQPKMADGFERCYHKSLAPRRDFEARLRAQKKSDEDIQKAVAAAIKDGTLPQPPKAMMAY